MLFFQPGSPYLFQNTTLKIAKVKEEESPEHPLCFGYLG